MTDNDKCEHGQFWVLACSDCNAGVKLGLYPEPQDRSSDGVPEVAQAGQPIATEKRFAAMTHGELRTLVRRLGQPVGDATWNQLAVIAERAEAQGLVVQPAEAERANTSGLRIWVDGRKRAEERTTTITLTGSDIDHIQFIDALELATHARPDLTTLRALREAIIDAIGLVQK